jgi:hypothetical protein
MGIKHLAHKNSSQLSFARAPSSIGTKPTNERHAHSNHRARGARQPVFKGDLSIARQIYRRHNEFAR